MQLGFDAGADKIGDQLGRRAADPHHWQYAGVLGIAGSGGGSMKIMGPSAVFVAVGRDRQAQRHTVDTNSRWPPERGRSC